MSTPEGQLNRNMSILTRFLMQKQLMGQRTEGFGQLETQRHGNMMERMQAAFTNQLSRDPLMQRHRAIVFKLQQAGKDTAAAVEAMRKDALNQTKVAYTTATQKPWTEETAQAATLLTESGLMDMVGQAAMGARQDKQIEKVTVPTLGLRGQELEETEEARKLRERELEFEKTKEGGKGTKQRREDTIDLVKDTVNFLEAEGVEGEDADAKWKAFFGVGKITDPLSAENRGKAFTYLMEIWMKLIKNEELTPGDEKFLTTIRNVRAIETPVAEGGIEGLPSPALGGESEAQIRQNMINQIAEYIKGKGVDPAQAISLATEFYDSRIRK